MVKALIGLGNTGAEYERTYHNVGVFVAREIAELAQADGLELRVYEPTGFMNVSGLPVRAWIKQNNVSLAECVVVHDESDLTIGQYKLSLGGGSAGHKGIESIASALGTEEFWRLRVGVRDPSEVVRTKAGEFVLTRWRAADEEAFRAVAQGAWQAIKARSLK